MRQVWNDFRKRPHNRTSHRPREYLLGLRRRARRPHATIRISGRKAYAVDPTGRASIGRPVRRVELIGGGAVAALVGVSVWWRRNPSACPYNQRFWVQAPHPIITRKRLLEILEPAPGERLLEIGPGTGYYSLPVAERLSTLLQNLGLRRVHVAGGFAPNALELVKSHPESVASMTLVCPMQLPAPPFAPPDIPLLVF